MDSFIQTHEPALRLAAFLGLFAAMALWELRAPRSALAVSRLRRWSANLGLVVLNTLLPRLAFPVAAVGLAATATSNGWGLLNQMALPAGVELLLALVALDLTIWAQPPTRPTPISALTCRSWTSSSALIGRNRAAGRRA